MKTTKLFFMAALALMTAACSNDDNDLTTQQPQKAEGITITAQLAPKTGGADTRAVSDGGNKIVAEWAVDEHIAVLYTKDATPYAADATITAVDGYGAATIEFTVEAGTPDNTACTLVYPYDAAKDDHTGVKDAATLLATQDGVLDGDLDVRVGAGTIQTTTPGLTVNDEPAAQFAIFKFTTKNSDGSATIDVTSLTVTTGGQDYVITSASATSELFVALPAISGQAVTFTATDSESKTYTASKASVTFAAGKYYQSTLKMKELTIVTWNSTNVFNSSNEGVTISKFYELAKTFEGVTISFTGSGAASHFNIYNEMDGNQLYINGGQGGVFTFTAPSGKIFTKIEIINSVAVTFTPYGDWTKPENNKIMWSGAASSTVTLAPSGFVNCPNVTSIVFTMMNE